MVVVYASVLGELSPETKRSSNAAPRSPSRARRRSHRGPTSRFRPKARDLRRPPRRARATRGGHSNRRTTIRVDSPTSTPRPSRRHDTSRDSSSSPMAMPICRRRALGAAGRDRSGIEQGAARLVPHADVARVGVARERRLHARICRVGDVTLRVRHGGDGQPMVLLHGHPRMHTTWHRIAPQLAGSFFVARPDLRAKDLRNN
jgi:hypothetical protein